ncbi:hypothetical protein ACFLT1_06245 [Bacteroidota bacterium]
MKKLAIIFAMTLGIFAHGNAQTNVSLGGGISGSSLSSAGFLFEAEFDKVYSEEFSRPLQLHTGFYNDKEGNNVLFTDLHRGYRLTFQNGLFLEQSFGIGVMLTSYKEHPYYNAENGNIGFFPSGKGWDLVPSVTLGAGYNIDWKNGAKGSIWCKPKIFWKIPFDNPAQPKFALQLGYSHKIK